MSGDQAFRRVLVTGAAGLLGRATLDLLTGYGVPVTALDRADSGDLPADRVLVGDAGDPALVRAALDGVDAVIHLAAIPSPQFASAEEVFAGNARATFVVLAEAAEAGVRRMVLASSYSILGLPFSPHPTAPTYLPIDESSPLQVADPYALSKQADEATAAMIARRYGATVVALRLPFLGTPQGRLAARAARLAEDPTDGVADLWSYLDTRDAARACWLGLTRPLDGCHAVFVAAPETLAKQSTVALLDRFHPGVPCRAALPGRTVPIDLAPARRLLGFTAEHPYPVEGDR